METQDLLLLQKELGTLLEGVGSLNAALARARWPDYMTVNLAARYLGLSPSHINKLRSTGGGPPFCDFGAKAVRYRRADLDQWAEEHKRAHTAEKQALNPTYTLARERRKNRKNVLTEARGEGK